MEFYKKLQDLGVVLDQLKNINENYLELPIEDWEKIIGVKEKLGVITEHLENIIDELTNN